jgi:pyruvate/2-oxoglutarate dehydrogenase complex dihydrolipoamide acyltransferase (E2) component
VTEVRVPDFNAGQQGAVEEAELVEWHVESGEGVVQGQEILQLELDKVTVAVEAPTAGILRQVAKVGSLLRPGDIVGTID